MSAPSRAGCPDLSGGSGCGEATGWEPLIVTEQVCPSFKRIQRVH